MYTIALADLSGSVEPGDELFIGAHAVVERQEGDEVRQETAWGDGERFVQKGNWATYFPYTVQ